MTDYIDTREGWRKVDYAPMDGEEEYLVHTPVDDTKVTYWARVPPAPPLPTAEHTSIKVTWRSDLPEEDPVFTLREMTPGFRWWNERGPHYPEWLAERITGFEVLAEPRAVTAKALMLRLQTLRDGDGENWREQILREFGGGS